MGYRGVVMQDLGCELPRISIPRTRVNKKLVLRCVFVRGGQGWRRGSGRFATVVRGERSHLRVLGGYPPPLSVERFIYRVGRARERSYL
jgi:hypothetical protein